MIYEVDIEHPDMVELLDLVASQAGISTNEYVTNIVRGWAETQLRGRYQDVLKSATMDDLKAIAMAFAARNKA